MGLRSSYALVGPSAHHLCWHLDLPDLHAFAQGRTPPTHQGDSSSLLALQGCALLTLPLT